MSLSKILASVMTGALAMATLPAMAGSYEPPSTSKTISAKGFDLSREADAKIVFARIEAAAKDVCHDLVPRSSAILHYERKICVRDAVANAVESVNTPAMFALLEQARR